MQREIKSDRRVAPGFIGVGVPKAGTTWVEKILRLHPEIWMPPVKEVHFFDDYYRYGANLGLDRYFSDNPWVKNRWRRYFRSLSRYMLRYPSYSNIRWVLNFLAKPISYQWYSSLFKQQQKLTGEFTPDYCTLTYDQVKEVGRNHPQVKILIMLRNPIDRAWSHCKMELFARCERDVNEVSLTEIREFLFTDKGVLARSDYSNILEYWYQVFGQEQVFVGLLDDVKYRPAELAREIFEFLGVNPNIDVEGSAYNPVHVGKRIKLPAQIYDELVKYYTNEIVRLDILYPKFSLKKKWLQ